MVFKKKEKHINPHYLYMIMRTRYIAINDFLLAEVRVFETTYKFKSTNETLDVLFHIGYCNLMALLLRNKIWDIKLKKILEYKFNDLNIPKKVDINKKTIRINKLHMYHEERYSMLIDFVREVSGFPVDYSFSRLFSYMVYLGLDYFVANKYFEPSMHINFNVDKINEWEI